MNPPLVSVVTPCFNAEPYLAATLQSVVAQTLQDWELIVVDDGSTDASREVLARWSAEDRRIAWQERRNPVSGPSSCRNQGLSTARGRYVLFLDADDLLAPHCLQARTTYMEAHPECRFAVFQMQLMDGNGRPLAEFVTRNCKDYLGAFVSFAIPWQTSGPLWRTAFVRSLGGFDERLPAMEDPHLHVRALLRVRGSSQPYQVLAQNPPDAYYRVTGKCRPFHRIAAAAQLYCTDVARLLMEANQYSNYRHRLRALIYVFWKYMEQSSRCELLASAAYREHARTFYCAIRYAGLASWSEYVLVPPVLSSLVGPQTRKSHFLRHMILRLARRAYKQHG